MIYKIVAISSFILYLYISPKVLQLIWPDIIVNKTLFYVGALQFVNMLSYISINLCFYFIYQAEHPYFEQYKVEPKPWPWKENLEFWKKLKKNTIINYIQNSILATILATIQGYFMMNFRMDSELPGYIEICSQIIIFALIEDTSPPTIFLQEHPQTASYLQYHKYKHYKLVSISAEYAHPIEYVLGNLIPVLAGPTLLGSKVHFATILIWIGIAIHKTLSDHSGYQFPWELYQYIPYSTHSDFHSFHHSQNVGNYSSTFMFWDKWLGTQIVYDSFKKVKQ